MQLHRRRDPVPPGPGAGADPVLARHQLAARVRVRRRRCPAGPDPGGDVAADRTVSRGYGSTEHPTATTSNDSDELTKRAETDGRPVGAAELRLAADGELEVRGPELFLGYLDESLNDDAFTTDGWFRTGDLAQIDEDGFVDITGRKKDLIIRSGENLSAKEIEDQLFGHPKIADVAIVASPDPRVGEQVCAVVVPQTGAEITLADLVEWLTARRMARQKLPERMIVVDELPRNASGKVRVRAARLGPVHSQRSTVTEAVPSPTLCPPWINPNPGVRMQLHTRTEFGVRPPLPRRPALARRQFVGQ